MIIPFSRGERVYQSGVYHSRFYGGQIRVIKGSRFPTMRSTHKKVVNELVSVLGPLPMETPI